jgi:hypothetical protein
MKAKIIIFEALAIGLLIALIVFCLYLEMQQTAGKENKIENTFDLSDYSWELENCGYEKNVGDVATKNIAIQKAKQLWEERFGDMYMINNFPVAVAYDPKNECWRVNGTLKNNNIEGAVPCAIISKDGTVLALWIG